MLYSLCFYEAHLLSIEDTIFDVDYSTLDEYCLRKAKGNPTSPELEGEFLKAAAEQGMVQLKGHRSVGGIRASIYNAMPKGGVEKLVALMKSFQAKHTS